MVTLIQVTKGRKSNGYTYYIRRGAMAEIDPRWVGTEGQVRVESTRNSVVNCFENDCNTYAFNDLPLPPVIGPKESKSVSQCLACDADTVRDRTFLISDRVSLFLGWG